MIAFKICFGLHFHVQHKLRNEPHCRMFVVFKANNFESHDIVPGDGEADLGNDEFNINDILDAIKCDHTSMNDYDAYCDAFTIVSDENGVGVGGMEAATAVSTGDGGCKEDDAYVTGARPCKFVPPPPPEQPPSPLEDVLPVAEYAEMGTLVMDDGTSLTEETISVRTFLSVGEVLQGVCVYLFLLDYHVSVCISYIAFCIFSGASNM